MVSSTAASTADRLGGVRIVGMILLLPALGAACTDGAPDARDSEAGAAEANPAPEPAVWNGTTPGGIEITVHPPTAPIRPGPVRFVVELGEAAPAFDQVSVDLVAPEMPAHGIVRFDAVSESNRRFIAEVEVPMEGRWLLYVNLDVGVEAVPFEFRVEPGEGGPHDHHHHGDGGNATPDFEDGEAAYAARTGDHEGRI